MVTHCEKCHELTYPGHNRVCVPAIASARTARQRALQHAAGAVRVHVPAGVPLMELDWHSAKAVLEARARRLRVPDLGAKTEDEAFEEAMALDPLAADIFLPSLETLRRRYAALGPGVERADSVNKLLAEAAKVLVAKSAGRTYHDEYRNLLNNDRGLKEAYFREKHWEQARDRCRAQPERRALTMAADWRRGTICSLSPAGGTIRPTVGGDKLVAFARRPRRATSSPPESGNMFVSSRAAPRKANWLP